MTESEHASIRRFSSEDLNRRAVERRAVDAVLWGMPAVNFERLKESHFKAGGKFNQVAIWSRLPDWKNQTLTPNPDVIYLIPFYNTKEAGPIVLEIPPSDDGTITGSFDDGWQTAIEDVGPAGVDKGKGGKYLILPPDYKDAVPVGYIPMPSATYAGYALLRSNLKSGSAADVAKAVAYGKRVQIYPLAEAAHPHETTFVDVIDILFDSTIPYDLRFFQHLNNFVQREPWIQRDRVMIDHLRTIGIEKGMPFNPDADNQAILTDGVHEAKALLDSQYASVFSHPYFENTHWAFPASPEFAEALMSNYANPDSYPVDSRGLIYSYVFFSTKHLGQGQYYLMTIHDKDGHDFDGASTYHLKVPANPPVKLYWSATIYDRDTHALIRDMPWSSRASTTPGIQKNTDGSVDIYFGPKSPPGKDSNWIPTRADGKFEVLFRFYGPEKPLFEKTWRLPDIEKI